MGSGPPWRDENQPPWRFHGKPRHGWPRHAMPLHSADWRVRRRALFRRFMFAFGLLVALFAAAIFAISAILRQFIDIPVQTNVLLGLCAVPLGFVLVMLLLGGLIFRRYGSPVAEVMAAADAVAEGDLSVRVNEQVPGDVGRLARSFNRMTAELERAEQQRRNLTADVAHELRTPLHVIQGNLEGMIDGVYQASPEQLEATLEETRLLARLVGDLQTLSLAEAGELPLHRVRFMAGDLLADAAANFAGQAAAAGVSLRVEGEAGDAALEIEGDPDRLAQVIGNLVANALRHTPAGGAVTLSAQAGPERVRLVVQDTGAGIAAEDLPFIFDRFWRGDPSRTRQEGAGSGLGLAIARRLVELHGGTIRAESQVGAGTTFVIELPRAGAVGEP